MILGKLRRKKKKYTFCFCITLMCTYPSIDLEDRDP